MRNAVQLCLAANNILHMRKGNRAFLLLAIALAWKWQIASLPEDIHKINKLGDRMIKQLLNSVTQDIVICQCLADQLFASALLNLVQ